MAHVSTGCLRVAVANGQEDGPMFFQNPLQTRAGSEQRKAMDLHSNSDMRLQRLHGVCVVVIVRGLRDREVEREVSVVPVLLLTCRRT